MSSDIVWSYLEGEWKMLERGHEDVMATVHYSDEPCAETGCVGWCWWAAGKDGGKFGDAKTQAEAEEKAELSLRKRGYL